MYKKTTANKVVVRVRKTHNDTMSITGVDGKDVDLWFQTDFNKYDHVVINAKVVAVPDHVHSAPVETTYMSTPVAKSPSGKLAEDQEFTDVGETSIDIRPNDTIYFHYLGINETAYLDTDSNLYKYYWVPVDSIFCTVRKGKILPQNGYVFVEEAFEEGVEDIKIEERGITRTVKGKVSDSGIVYSIGEKCIALEGVVAHVGYDIGNYEVTYKKGDRVLYKKSNEFRNNIEGKDYFVMKQKEIFATFNSSQIIPTFTYIIVEDKNRKDRETHNGIFIGGKNRKDEGIIESIGSSVTQIEPGDKVRFCNGTLNYMELEGKDILLIREEDVYFKYL